MRWLSKVLALKWLKTSFDEVVLRDSQKCWTFFTSITRWHGSARVYQGRQRKSMEKWEIRPPLPQKPLNRSSQKFAWVITSGTLPLCKISSRYDYPPSPPKYAKMRIK